MDASRWYEQFSPAVRSGGAYRSPVLRLPVRFPASTSALPDRQGASVQRGCALLDVLPFDELRDHMVEGQVHAPSRRAAVQQEHSDGMALVAVDAQHRILVGAPADRAVLIV